MKNRLKAAFMLVVWVLSFISSIGFQIITAEAPETLFIKNNIIELSVNRNDGRFAIKTVEGSPKRPQDDNAPLLFLKDVPETTFTTFRIDGKDYIYGNSYSGILMDGGFTTSPTIDGMKSNSVWKAGDITITQNLELTDNISSSDVGNVKISYSITNTGTKAKEVGTRILLDMMLGSNDGCSVSLDGKKDVSYEEKVTGKDIPLYWRCTDAVDNPKVVAYGFIKGWGNTEPDSMTIAHWNSLSTTKWDYSINPERNIGSSLNDYKSADSAAALYWEPKMLEPGKTMQVETYYGLGNINESADGSTFDLNVLAPAKLSIEGDKYKDNPFDIMMELDNSLESSTELAGITAELILPEGLELAPGEESNRYFYRIPVKHKQSAQWKVNAINTQKLKVLQYMIRITCMGGELKTIKKFIIIPGFEKDDFDIGYTDLVPRTLYYGDEDNAIQILGYGFDKLRDKSSYEMSLVDISKGNVHYLGEFDITVVNDNQIRIRIKGLETGIYKLVINHKNDMLDHTLAQNITITSDTKYKSRNYGILAIKEKDEGGKKVQTAELFENESQLSAADKSSAILIIRGKVRNVSEGKFDIYGDTIGINNDIYYKGYGDKTLSVNKSGGSYIVKGNGELYMQSALMGKSMEITLKKGQFYIDSASAIIQDEEGYTNDTSILYVGYFPILVKEIKIQNNGEAKIEGILKLENKYFNFLTGVGTGFMESDIKDMSITNKKINIDTEIKIPFPRWKLGGFQSKDYLTKTTTNITFFINTIKGAYGFKTQAENPKLRLLDIDATMAFDKNLYPDYFEFENEYGDIPEPIGSTGLAFESIGGGIYGLKSMIDSLRYGILPTGSSIVARADIADLLTYHTGRIKGKTLLGLRDIEAVLSCSGLDLKGDAYIYFIDVGDIIGHFDFSGGYIQSNINVFDILIMDSYFGISSREIRASMSGKLQIPDYVWFVGGEEVGSFKAELSTEKIEGSVKVLGVGVGVKYKWGGSVSFKVASMGSMDKKGIYTVYAKDEEGKDVVITYGTNIEKLQDISYSYNVCYGGDTGKALALGASAYTYKAEIGESVESAIIEMKYDSSVKPEITVTDPNGNVYELVEGVNYKNHIIPADVSQTGIEEKRLFVTIVSPKPGKWTIQSDEPVTMTLYNAKEPAAFKTLTAEFKEDKIKTDWTLNNTDGSKVSLYLLREGEASGYIELGKDLVGSPETYECAIPEGVTTGSYKVRGEVKRDGTGYNYMDSEAFEIVDAKAPEVPTAFTVETSGNGMMRAQWTGATDVDEYRIYAVDDEGQLDSTVLTMISESGDKTNTTFGGTQKDGDGKEYGWIPGRTYNFALYAVKLTGEAGPEVEHISKPVYSGEVELPVPKPPVFTASLTAENGNINIEKDDNDNEIYYTNEGYINCSYQSDSFGDVVFYINGEKVDEAEGKDYSLQLNLQKGGNLIEIEATGDSGDKAKKAYEFYYDDKAPDLMVQSPNSDDVIQEGSVLVSGVTSANCRLYVNGTQLTVEEDGSFNEEYMLSNMHRETITIASVDLAGNRTEYSTEVFNSEVGNVVKVQIMPEVVQMRVGDSVQMMLYGITKDSKKVLLEGDKADWQLYDTEGIASMTEGGLLSAKNPGEIVINVQYAISSDMIYEDALIINILPKSSGKNEDKDEDDSIDIPNNSTVGSDTKKESLLKKILDFRANEEIIIPGLIKLRFTGNEVSNGYIEIQGIEDLLEYREGSGKKDFLSNIYDIKVLEGYEFNSPVELTIYFDKNKVKSLKHIAIYVYNEKDETWELVGGVVDEANGSVTVRVPHFSKYAVMENSKMTLMTDMDKHWAKDAVYRLIDRGIVNGIRSAVGEYRFEPERAVSRAEFAKMLSLSGDYIETDTNSDLSHFTDDAEILPWARPYMKYCNKKGWINGKGIGKAVYMKPNDTITRAEAAVMVSRALGFAAADKNVKAAFSDKSKIPDWAVGYIDQITEKKLMQGYSDGTFRPDQVLIRAEAAALFDNYLKLKK